MPRCLFLVLLVACANTTALLLSWTETRRKEVAVRFALGVSRLAIFRQFVTESIVLSVVSSLGSILLAYWLISILKSLNPQTIPRLHEVSLNISALGITLQISTLVGFLCGLIPAVHLGKLNVNESLKENAGSATLTKRKRITRNALVITEITLAFITITCAALVVRSFRNVQPAKPGFDPSNKLTMEIDLLRSKYSSPEQKKFVFNQMLEGIRTMPSVKSVAAITTLPLVSSFLVKASIEGQVGENNVFNCHYRAISTGYLKLMHIPLLSGRNFEDADNYQTEIAAVINRLAAAMESTS